MSAQDRSKPRRVSKKIATILGVVIVGCIFALPIIPMTYHLPYLKEVPVLAIIVQTNVLVNATSIPLEGGAYEFWHIQIDDYKTVNFSLESSETVHAAIMTSEEFEAFQDTTSVNQSTSSELGADSIELKYQIPVTETYYFVAYNHHDGSQGTEVAETMIDSVTITESWEEEGFIYQIEEGVRNMTTMITLWQMITGSAPVF